MASNGKPKTLIDTNPYIRDPKALREMIAEDVRQSCAFEGAKGIDVGKPHSPRKRRSIPSAKNPRKSS